MLTVLIATVVLFIVGCSNDNVNKNVGAESNVSKITKSNEFISFSLLQDVEPDENGNIFISPTSALIAMLMVYNGTDDKTKLEIEQALQIDGLSEEEVNTLTTELINNLQQSDKKIEVDIANSIWINDQYSFNEDFAKKMRNHYNAEIDKIDIYDNKSADIINDWVKKATNDMIEEIVEAPLPEFLITYIINALYFNGTWTHEFDKDLTYPDLFYTEDGEKELEFMSIDEEFEYFETGELQAVKLPYGDGNMNMQIFLPREDVNIDDFVKRIDTSMWEKWQKSFSEQKGTVRLPKFKLEYETLLNEPLIKLGIIDAFDPNEANFSKMVDTEDQLFISEVKQKTAIEVDEKGTEAAAVTSVQIETLSAIVDDDKFYIDVNHPFIFTIYDEVIDNILFIGLIKSPDAFK